MVLRLLGFLMLTGSMVMVACGPGANQGGTAATDSPASVEKQYGGIFQYASQSPPDGLYWFDQGTIGSRGRPMSSSHIWNPLITYDLSDPEADYEASGKYVGALAESWSLADPKTFVFNLRRGVKWHDGAEFSSKDVVWSLARWGDNGTISQARAVARKFDKVEAIGSHQVRVTLKEADPEFLVDIARPHVKILPAHIAEAAGNPTGDALRVLYEKSVVGTGAYKLRSFDRQKSLETERFEEFWGGRPYLEGTRTIFGLERSAMQAAFMARELDYVSFDDRVQFDTVKAVATDAKRIRYISSHNWGLQFNTQRKPFDDVRVRKAIHLALDRQKLLDAVTFGEGMIPPPAPILPTLAKAGWGLPQEEYMKLPGWRPQKDQDIAEAKRLLTEAGYPNGFKTVLMFRRGLSHAGTQSEPVASQMRAIGVDMEVRPTEPALFADQVYLRREFEIISESGTADYAMSATAYAKWHSKGNTNYTGVNDPELDRLIEAVQAEQEREKRNQLFTQMQRIIAEKAYYTPIVTLAQFLGVQPWVYEFFPTQSVSPELLDAHRLWMDVNSMPAGRRKF